MPNPQMWYLLQDDLQMIKIIGLAKIKLNREYNQKPESNLQIFLQKKRTELETGVLNKYGQHLSSTWEQLTLRQAIALHQWLRQQNKSNKNPNTLWKAIERLDVSSLAVTDAPTEPELVAYDEQCKSRASELASLLMKAESSDNPALYSVFTIFAEQPELSLRIRFV